jgi:hypothetical protein
MTEPRLLQNFSGSRAILVTDRASSLDVLTTTLTRLGVATDLADIVETAAAIDVATLQPERDIIFIDGDIGGSLLRPIRGLGDLFGMHLFEWRRRRRSTASKSLFAGPFPAAAGRARQAATRRPRRLRM